MKEQYDEIDLVDYIKIIYKRRIIVLGFIIAGMLYAATASLRTPLMYEASATFFPLDMNYDIKAEEVVIKPKLDIKDLIVSLLESRKIADRVIKQLDLERLWGAKNTTSAQDALRKSIEINIEKKGLIKLTVRTISAELSARIANAYVENLNYLNTQLDIGAQRNIVQVIDTATAPDQRLPRGTVKKMLRAGIGSFFIAVVLVILIEFVKTGRLIERLKE